MNSFVLLSFVLLFRIGYCKVGTAEDDLITDLPGLTFEINYNQYSGYLESAPSHFLHYWFMESQSNPKTDPIVLWLNGGPGCSSLGGLTTELGPFWPNPDGKTVFENVFSWNKALNMIFLESPINVGFSYTTNSDNSIDDTQTALENFVALQQFFDKFPAFKTNDFYITGESYCGVYIPMLAQNVVKGIKEGNFSNNFKGYAIGNGILSVPFQHNSVIKFMYYHGLIGTDDYEAINDACCPNSCSHSCDYYSSLKYYTDQDAPSTQDQLCANWTYHISDHLLWDTLNDAYNIYQDCYTSNWAPLLLSKSNKSKKQIDFETTLPLIKKLRDQYQENGFGAELHKLRLEKSTFQPGSFMEDGRHAVNVNSTDANGGFSCYGSHGRNIWLNTDAVKSALHIPSDIFSRKWVDCADETRGQLNYTANYINMFKNMSEPVQYVMQQSDARILIYNGDVDMVCNYLGDEWFSDQIAADLGLKPLNHRGYWSYSGEIAGYVKKFERFDVLTVKGSGHFVPADRPGPALQMIMNFIRGNKYSEPTGIDIHPAALTGDATYLSRIATFWLVLVPISVIMLIFD